MEHADALERIELAVLEPDGLERLMAGDTPDAAVVAGHLAGCPACFAEMTRIRRTALVAREVIREQPDPALRERTLAFVRAVGRDRSSPATATRRAEPTATPLLAPVLPLAPAGPIPFPRRAARTPWAWVAAVAAAVVIAAASFTVGGASRGPDLASRDGQIALLRDATQASLQIQGQADARRVTLAAADGWAGADGTFLFSPGSGELVAVASGLQREAAGQEYGCWVEVGGRRVRIGRMDWAGSLWTWAGPVPGLADLPPGTVFGVSLGPVDGSSPSEPVLTGRL